MHRKNPVFIFSMILLLAILGQPFLSAAAQSPIERVQITQVDSGSFPSVSVQAIIRDGDGDPIPEKDLVNMELLEDGKPVKIDLREKREAGVEVMFVLDLGLGIYSPGATYKPDGLTRNSRFEEMQEIVKGVLNRLKADDTAGVLAVQPEKSPSVVPVQTLTSDVHLLMSKVDELSPNPTTPSFPSEGLKDAITALNNSQAHHETKIQSIIFISSGRLDSLSKFTALAANALRDGITVHAVEVSGGGPEQIGMRPLAESTHGIFRLYASESGMADIYSWIDNQRTQYRFTFPSTSSSSNDRVITLRTVGSGLSQKVATATYKVEVKAPVVEIVTPTNDQLFLRAGTSPQDDPAKLDPVDTTIKVRVIWPDQHPRSLKRVQLYLDSNTSGPPLLGEEIKDTQNILFKWDLIKYPVNKTTNVTIEVEVEDELQLIADSKPVNVRVEVNIPTATAPPAETPTGQGATPAPIIVGATITCRELSGLNWALCQLKDLAGILALGVALLALALVVAFRGRIAGAAVQVGDAVRQTIARITRPPQTEIGAYLNVVKGAEDLPRNRFPIYLNTVTPIGRDKRQAELVFDENAERSVVSRIHCEITESGGHFTIRDLGSSHGTYINSQRLSELGVQQLFDGDQIELGPVERGGILLSFELARDSGAYEMAAEPDIQDRQTEASDFSKN